MPDGRVAVGTWCEHSYYYDPKDGKFYDSFMLNDGFGSCRMIETQPSADNLEQLRLFREGTYFDATSENKNDWHHKYQGQPRARSMGRWADEEPTTKEG
jgi:hypothetical protein